MANRRCKQLQHLRDYFRCSSSASSLSKRHRSGTGAEAAALPPTHTTLHTSSYRLSAQASTVLNLPGSSTSACRRGKADTGQRARRGLGRAPAGSSTEHCLLRCRGMLVCQPCTRAVHTFSTLLQHVRLSEH